MVQTYSYQTWASALLANMGNATPSTGVRNFVIGWEEEEGGGLHNACQYNSLNTTLPFGGSSSCTSIGVQSYPDFNTGVAANVATLRQGYPSLSSALQSNDSNALGVGSGPMSNGVAQDLSKWVSGRSNPIQTSYINSIEKLAGGTGTGSSIPGTSDPCLGCGAVGTAAYAQCHAALAAKVGSVPACANAGIQQNQSQIGDCISNPGACVQNAILGPIEQFLGGYIIKGAIFAFSLVLVVFGFIILQG